MRTKLVDWNEVMSAARTSGKMTVTHDKRVSFGSSVTFPSPVSVRAKDLGLALVALGEALSEVSLGQVGDVRVCLARNMFDNTLEIAFTGVE